MRRQLSVTEPKDPSREFRRLHSEVMQTGGESSPPIDLEDFVQCAICMERLSDPRMLPCQHTFCYSCIQTHLLAERVQAQHLHPPSIPQLRDAMATTHFCCPTCRAKVPLANGMQSLNDLPQNLYVNSLLGLLDNRTTKEKASNCVMCQTSCDKGHFCQHCKQTFCDVCWVSHVNDIKKKITELEERLRESWERLDHRENEANVRFERLRLEVAREAEVRRCLVDALQKDAENRVSEIQSETLDTAKAIRQKIIEAQGKANSKQIDSDSAILPLFRALHSEVSAILNDISKWTDTRAYFDNKTFTVELEDLEPEPAAEEAEEADDNPSSVALHLKKRSFTPKSVWTKCPRCVGLALSPWDTDLIYVAGSDSRLVLLMDHRRWKIVQKISSPQMLCPQGIAVSAAREEIYVTDKWRNCVHVFSRDGRLLREMLGKGSAAGHVSSPEGIAVDAKDRLYVCDAGKDRVLIVNPADGNVIHQLGISKAAGSSSKISTEFNYPSSIALNEDIIVIADSGNKRIKTYSTKSWSKISEFGSAGKLRGQFRSPEVVAVDSKGFIWVGDAGNARVQIFQPDGSLAKIFGKPGSEPGRFGWISGICFTVNQDVIVSDFKNRRMQVF